MFPTHVVPLDHSLAIGLCCPCLTETHNQCTYSVTPVRWRNSVEQRWGKCVYRGVRNWKRGKESSVGSRIQCVCAYGCVQYWIFPVRTLRPPNDRMVELCCCSRILGFRFWAKTFFAMLRNPYSTKHSSKHWTVEECSAANRWTKGSHHDRTNVNP